MNHACRVCEPRDLSVAVHTSQRFATAGGCRQWHGQGSRVVACSTQSVEAPQNMKNAQSANM